MQQPYGRFVWHDLMTTEIEAAIDFFVGLFGWTMQVVDTAQGKGSYRVFHAADRAVGGCVALEPDRGVPSHWLGYVSVEDVDSVAAASDGAGGSQVVPPTEIPRVGKIAVLRDPSGGTIAPLQRDSEAEPPPRNRGDSEICWNELHSPDRPGSAAYYAATLGWGADERVMGVYGTYTVFRDGTADVAGLTGRQVASLPFPVWVPYVRVTDLTQTANRARQLGGTFWLLPVEVPEVGSVAIISDPSGAPTGVIQMSG